MEALQFIVNNLSKNIDFKTLRESFRILDTQNTGFLTFNEIKEACKDSAAISQEDLKEIFKSVDFEKEGGINYSVFLAATVDKQKALTKQNLLFAFHHYDVSNSGFITEESLIEVFHREGKKLTREQIHEIMEGVD